MRTRSEWSYQSVLVLSCDSKGKIMRILLEETDSITPNLLREFLSAVEFSKFRSWPRVTQSNVTEFLFDELSVSNQTQKVFLGTSRGQIVVLLAFHMLKWDSKHFGFPSGQISHLLYNKETDSGLVLLAVKKVLKGLQNYCSREGIRFVAADVDSWNSEVNIALQDVGFQYILSWIDGYSNYVGQIPNLPDGAEIGFAHPEELSDLSLLSRNHSFKGGRFYLDHRFDSNKVDEMYGELLLNSFQADDVILVYRLKSKPIGVFVCKKITSYSQFSDLRVAPLRYLCVDPKYRKNRVGFDLFAEMLMYLDKQSDLITTGLEIHNTASANLHSKLGFVFNYTHNAFHWWNSVANSTE